jgi:signal transduction histidine kinase
VQPLALRKRIELKLVAAGACQVNCDLERMERVFVNLLSNALKFTPEGGHVTVSVHDLGDTVWIVVKDDGPGFPPEMAERLFERFFQVDMGETRRYGGTGIGLALAREIVELHGGRIRAESDRGARFTVELVKDKEHFRAEVLDRRSHRRDVLSGARAGDRGLMDFAAQMRAREEFRLLDIHEATERRALARDPEEDSRRHTCLVVEDTPDVIRLVGMALQQDFKMLSAPDGAQGLEMARKELPSLIVTDLMMPGMDGLELTRRLRDDPTTRHIPIVMLTARGELEDRVAGMDTGVNTYLAKPFSPRELLSSARSLVKTQAAQADILLTQRMDSLESIAGGLAHEINNPLNYVKNALARVRMDTHAVLDLSPAAFARRVRGDAGRGGRRAPGHRPQGECRAALRGRRPGGVRSRGIQPGGHQPGAERHRGGAGGRQRPRGRPRADRGRAAGAERQGQRPRHQGGGPRAPLHSLLHHQGAWARHGDGADDRLARRAEPGRDARHRQHPGARRLLHPARSTLAADASGRVGARRQSRRMDPVRSSTLARGRS